MSSLFVSISKYKLHFKALRDQLLRRVYVQTSNAERQTLSGSAQVLTEQRNEEIKQFLHKSMRVEPP